MIPRDAEQKPAQRPTRWIKPLGIAYQSHENLLRHIFRHRRVPAHAQRKPVYRRMLPTVQQRERSLVPGHHPPKQQPLIDAFHAPIHLRRLDGPAQLSLHIPPPPPESSKKMLLSQASGSVILSKAPLLQAGRRFSLAVSVSSGFPLCPPW